MEIKFEILLRRGEKFTIIEDEIYATIEQSESRGIFSKPISLVRNFAVKLYSFLCLIF